MYTYIIYITLIDNIAMVVVSPLSTFNHLFLQSRRRGGYMSIQTPIYYGELCTSIYINVVCVLKYSRIVYVVINQLSSTKTE